ncbi:MAG: hypothetical protein ABI211_29185 [Vicinamibacterales bacterium]
MKSLSPAVLLTLWALIAQGPPQATAPVAAQTSAAVQTARPAVSRDVATHATKGVVKALTPSGITITRVTAGKRVDTSFQLTASTQRAGTIAAGVTVEIRYRTDGKQRIATAISVEAPPQ